MTCPCIDRRPYSRNQTPGPTRGASRNTRRNAMETRMGARLTGALLGAAALLLSAGTAGAADVELPETMAWTAYDTGSAGHAHAVAMGKAFKEKYGVNLRVLPGKNRSEEHTSELQSLMRTSYAVFCLNK